ncbi:MAG: haloacid dehalogenase type II [Alphaproteobacteria bacterium]
MARISQIKACVFDAYGTLFNIHAPVARVAGQLGDNADGVSNLWRQKQLQYTWLRALMRAHVDFWQVTGEALEFALEAHKIDDPGLHKQLMELYLTLDAYDDVAPALGALRAGGKKTAILSNGNPKMLNAAVASAGLGDLLDAALSVEDVGVYKPDARVYQLAVDTLGVKKQSICFVSTNGWDAAAAADFGFQVVWLNRFSQPWERLPGTRRATISGLGELAPLLE